MTLHDTHCCGVQEIHNLSLDPSAEASMVSFCKQNLGTKRVKFQGDPAFAGTIYSFYIFTAAVYDTHHIPYNDYRMYQPYGKEFAEFIRKNKLGNVIEAPALTNDAFHPDHKNQVWVWMPNLENLRAWWEAYQEEHPTNRGVKKNG